MAIQQYTIGRGDDNRIRIQDNSQRVSRNHATLKVMDNGKIYITDHSSNGTFVNGIKIAQNVDFPVKRADSISFANVWEFNWDLVPRKSNKVLLYSIIITLLVAIGGGAGWMFFKPELTPTPITEMPADSTGIDAPQTAKEDECAKQDSIKTANEKAKKEEAEAKAKCEAEAKKKKEAAEEKKKKEASMAEKDKPDSTGTSQNKQVF